MINGVNKRTEKQQLTHREMRHERRESTFKTRKDKAEGMMEPKEGRIREGKEGIRPQEFRSGNTKPGQNSQEGGQRGGSSPEERWVFCSGWPGPQDLGLPPSSPLGSRAKLGRQR